MRSSRLLTRTTAALLRRCGGQQCKVPLAASVCFDGVNWRLFSDEKKPSEENVATLTFTTNVEDHSERQASSPPNDKKIDPSEFTHEIQIRMPDMGESKAKVVAWFKQEGDIVKRNDVLCDIETEDFTFGMTVDDEEDGVMGKIMVEADSDPIDSGDLLCVILHRPPKGDKDTSKRDDANKVE